MTEYTRPALYAALPVLSQGKKWVLLYRYMENSFYSAMEIGDEVGCQRNARIARASRVKIHNAIDAWIVGMLLISDVVCEYQIVRMKSKNVVLGVEKKMYVIEQPILLAPAADFAANMLAEWNAVYDAYNEMLKELKSMFEKQAGVERFDLIQTFHAYKQEKGKPVAAYVLKMKGYVEQLERLGYVLSQDLSVGLILNGLTSDFAGFYEKGLPKKAETPQVMAIRDGKIQKANKKSLKAKGKGKTNGKGKDKQVYIPKPKNPKPSANEHLAKDDTFHHCKDVGHWKTNCPVYLAELLKKKKQVGSASSLVSKNNVHYFNDIPSNGIYEIDIHDLVPNVNSIYNVSTKRAKHNLDSTFLWHCRLAHISKKRIKKLQQEGLLKSTDDESFDQYVSCLSGKMTRKSFPHRPERATDLLGIIHTDVCGPLRHVSRQGASYFITFTVIIVVMDMFIFLNINMRSLKRSKYLKMKWKINSGRQSRLFDQIKVVNT
ncbi:zinc finger, CCHC-type containing protein [Tanacetum coccineum]